MRDFRNDDEMAEEMLQEKLDEFEQLCRRHDLTYMYSDDHRVWRRGHETLSKLRRFAERLPREKARDIWNKVVDTKLVPDARKQFYWNI